MTKKANAGLLLVLVLMPSLAFAHGEEVLNIIFIQIVSVVLFGVIIAAVKINSKGKVILTCVYIISTLVIWIISGTIPYNDNMRAINFTVAIGPLLVSYLFYQLNAAKYRVPQK
jgi:uncharacterized membrane protein